MIAIISPQLTNLDYMQAAYDMLPMYGREFNFVAGWIMVLICYLCLGKRAGKTGLILRLIEQPATIRRRPKQTQSSYG